MCKNLREIPIKKSKRLEGVALTLDENRAQSEEGSRLFPGKNSANEKPWILCLLESSQLSFYLCKRIILPFHVRISMFPHLVRKVSSFLQTPNCNSLPILNKLILAEKYLAVYLFQVHILFIKQRRSLKVPVWVSCGKRAKQPRWHVQALLPHNS